jgi:hypothetical protein
MVRASGTPSSFPGPLSGILRLGGAPWFYQRLLDREVEKVIELAAAHSGSGAGMPTSDDAPTAP